MGGGALWIDAVRGPEGFAHPFDSAGIRPMTKDGAFGPGHREDAA